MNLKKLIKYIDEKGKIRYKYQPKDVTTGSNKYVLKTEVIDGLNITELILLQDKIDSNTVKSDQSNDEEKENHQSNNETKDEVNNIIQIKEETIEDHQSNDKIKDESKDDHQFNDETKKETKENAQTKDDHQFNDGVKDETKDSHPSDNGVKNETKEDVQTDEEVKDQSISLENMIKTEDVKENVNLTSTTIETVTLPINTPFYQLKQNDDFQYQIVTESTNQIRQPLHEKDKITYHLKKKNGDNTNEPPMYILEKNSNEKPIIKQPTYTIQKINENGNIIYKILSRTTTSSSEINDEYDESIPISKIYQQNHLEIYKTSHHKLINIHNIPRNNKILYYLSKNSSYIIQNQMYVKEIVEKAIYLYNETIIDNISIKLLVNRAINELDIYVFLCSLDINKNEIKLIKKIKVGAIKNTQGRIIHENINHLTNASFLFTFLDIKSRTVINTSEIMYEETIVLNQKHSRNRKLFNIHNLDSSIKVKFD